jgi:hypothetical protein
MKTTKASGAVKKWLCIAAVCSAAIARVSDAQDPECSCGCYDDMREVAAPPWPSGDKVAIICGFQPGKSTCDLWAEASSCKMGVFFDPPLPSVLHQCYQRTFCTHNRCITVPHTVPMYYYSATPWCTLNGSPPPPCSDGCADEQETPSSQDYTYGDVDLQDCDPR